MVRVRVPSGSTLDRADACPRSHSLPWYDTQSSQAARRGTAFHDFKHRVLSGELPSIAFRDVPSEWQDFVSMVSIGASIADLKIVGSEQAYAYDVGVGRTRYIGTNVHREYGAGPNEVCASLDVVGVDTAGTFVYTDWKTGRQIRKARDSWQMRFGAMCVSEHYGVSPVKVRLVYVSDDGEDPYVDESVFADHELRAFKEDIRRIVFASRTSDPKIVMGDQCGYCQAMLACPAYRDAVRAFVPTAEGAAPDVMGIAYVQAKILMDGAETVIDLVKKAASGSYIPIGEKKRLAEIESASVHLNRDLVLQKILELGGTMADFEACYKKGRKFTVRVLNNE